MTKEIQYRGYTLKECNLHDSRTKELHEYGFELWKGSQRLFVTNHGWNLILSYKKDDCIRKAKQYIDSLIDKQK